jgi:hypothetical protein
MTTRLMELQKSCELWRNRIAEFAAFNESVAAVYHQLALKECWQPRRRILL